MKAVDRTFGWLLALGGILHGAGSWAAYHRELVQLLWALCASFAVLLLAAVNLVRAGRVGDRALAWISFAGCLVWIGFVVWFGVLIGNVLDFRPLTHLILSTGLALFSLRSARPPVHQPVAF